MAEMNRVNFHDDLNVVEIDLEGVRLTDVATVDALYDMLESRVRETGRQWWFLINYRDCRVDPEAWIEHARRGKILNEAWSLGSVRFDASPETRAEIAARAESDDFDANLFGDRDAALARLSQLRAEAAAKLVGRHHGADAIAPGEYARRVTFHREGQVMEADFSNFTFADSSVVNAFYDYIEKKLQETGAKWWFLVNYDNCQVYPEAWIAFAQRGKRVNENHSLGTVRFNPSDETAAEITARSAREYFDANLCATRDAALERIAELRAGA
jgi:hypothetical protein